MSKAFFQYYETFERIVQKFPNSEEQNNFRQKIINYGLFGVEPKNLTEKESFVWDLVKEMIDDQKHRRETNISNATKKKSEPAEEKPVEVTESAEILQKTETEQKKEPVKKFVKPTVEEVSNYCSERNNGINAQQFVDYYEARGWKIGNNSMKDWKAAVRTWEQRRINDPPYYGKKTVEWSEDKLTF